MPAFALANAVVDVSLSSSDSSAISGSTTQHPYQEAPPVQPSICQGTEQKSDHQKAVHPSPSNPESKRPAADPPQPDALAIAGQNAPLVQLLSQQDSVKWDQVAAWAAGDSAQAAALTQQLGPCIAESVASEADRDQALLRLEAQVARKKLVGDSALSRLGLTSNKPWMLTISILLLLTWK